MITLAYDALSWNISLKWFEGRVFFDSKWGEFIYKGGLSVGDTLVFRSCPEPMKLKISVLPGHMLKKLEDDYGKIATLS